MLLAWPLLRWPGIWVSAGNTRRDTHRAPDGGHCSSHWKLLLLQGPGLPECMGHGQARGGCSTGRTHGVFWLGTVWVVGQQHRSAPPRACSHHQAMPSMVEWQQENIFLPFLPALKQPQTRLKAAKTCRTMQRKSGSLFPIGNLPRSHLESICPHPYITPLQKRSENIEKIKYLLQRIGTRDWVISSNASRQPGALRIHRENKEHSDQQHVSCRNWPQVAGLKWSQQRAWKRCTKNHTFEFILLLLMACLPHVSFPFIEAVRDALHYLTCVQKTAFQSSSYRF